MPGIDQFIFSGPVREFWHTRERQADSQRQRGQSDQGSRGAVTGGKQMDGFSKTINFNNRIEEALGTAMDLWTAYREGAFHTSPAPWLGYLLLLEDCPESRRPVSVREPHFPVFAEFIGASYAKRYELFCRKLVRERQYNSACFITADRKNSNLSENYGEPAKDLAPSQFLGGLLGHAANMSKGFKPRN